MISTEPFDYIVIGAGQCGVPLARAFAEAGKKTALVESSHVGGTCVNEGCTPTKTMVASARVAYLARRAADYGIDTGWVTVDMDRVRARKRAIVDDFRGSGEKRLESTENLELITGEARFTAHKQVDVAMNSGGSRTLTAKTIVINAGGRPAIPPVDGLESVPYLTSTTIMELGVVPEHLVILGGGYIALEFAQMFRRFGSNVTILERGARLTAREDSDIAEALTKILTEDGLVIHTNTRATKVSGDDGAIRVDAEQSGEPLSVAGTHLLVAVGRTPNSDRLALDAAGIAADPRGNITVNEWLETNVPGIYAAGDINGGPQFTHISYDDYRILKSNLLEAGDLNTDGRLVPYVLYTDPQLGRVGLSEDQAKKKSVAYRLASIPMSYVARALETDESRGLMKALIEPGTDKILGCAVLGIEGGEIMSALQIAMMAGLPYTKLRDGIFAHPTLMESLNTLFASLEG